MLRKIFALTALLAALTIVAAGCDGDNPQQNRSVVYIESLNDNVAPVVSDVLTNGAVYPDAINVIFGNRPYSGIITTAPDRPYGNFEFTSYRVEFARGDGGQVPAPFTADMGLSVPSGYTAAANVTIVTWEMKSNPPLAGLPQNTQLNMNATITFVGHEAGTDNDVEVVAKIGVVFADFAD